jgi:hypothetical protein
MVLASKKCAVHSDKRALSFCQCCKEFFCENCLTEAGDYYFCAKPACVLASQEAVISKKEAARAVYASWFCDTCIDATEDSGGKTFLITPVVSVLLLGKKAQCPRCGSVQKGAWICIFFIPIFCIGRYRVIWLGRKKLVTRRLKPSSHRP